jgi:hypothetical protein
MGIVITGTRRFMTVAAVLLICPLAAAEPSISDKATARSLFEQGRALVREGKNELACPKLKESYDLDPGAGSAFHLADCYERTGRLASAWVLYLEVAVLMRDAGDQEKEAAARRRAEALAPRLSRLTIEVPAAHAVEGLTIARDGEEVGRGSWNTALPIDPGAYSVTATAPGREAWSTTVTIDEHGATARIRIPPLATVKKVVHPVVTMAPTPSNAPEDEGAGGWTKQQTTGLVVAGGGLLTFGVGTFLGFRAKSSYDDSKPYCDGDACSQPGLDIRADARGDANVATIVGGLGLAAMVGGAVLYVTAPSDADAASGGDIAVGIGPGSVLVRGAW